MSTPSATISLDAVPLSPRAKEIFETKFKPRLAQIQIERTQVPLTILVWGSGPGDAPMYAKRTQIRDELRRLDHAAFFSEDLAAMKKPGESEKTFEYEQAKSADVIIVLMVSFGSVAEVHDFADDRDIASKMLVFVSDAATGGYSYQGALTDLKATFRNVETFHAPDDIVSCRLKTIALDYVNHLQATKWLAAKKAESWS